MRRAELERRILALGWFPTEDMSGRNHRVWRHPIKERVLFVPVTDLVMDVTAETLIERAEEGR
jgi:hypothetical protein